MKLKLWNILDADRVREPVLLALKEIGERSNGRYPPEQVLCAIRIAIQDQANHALWLVTDEDAGGQVVGLTTIERLPDEVGNPIAVASRGWARKTHTKAKLLAYTLPKIEAWARQRGCVALYIGTDRSSMAVASQRLRLSNVVGRLRGLAAYWKWLAPHKFAMRHTYFEKELI
jgi:hypothetical protein